MQTPDPFLTSEQFGALAVTILTNLILLFKLDVSDAQQGALIALVNAAYTVFVFVHAAIVRSGRARRNIPLHPQQQGAPVAMHQQPHA